MFPNSNHYWLRNARVPAALVLRQKQGRHKDWSAIETGNDTDQLLAVDLEIVDGAIASIATAGTLKVYHHPSIDLRQGMVFPCFVDLHTHLDKGHISPRTPNPDGTFQRALAAVHHDAHQYWNVDDLYQRMNFGLKCSYAHGTQALRTHLDAAGPFATASFEVFQSLRETWRDRLHLQGVCLVSLDYFLTPAGEKLADRVADLGGILGGVAFMNPDLPAQIERVFALAKERSLPLDFHADENGDPDSTCLAQIAEATLRHHYQDKVVCGHCCSLAVQSPKEVKRTIALIKRAKLGIVSLPLCNLYLQDRQARRTPRWRGITLLHELHQAKVPVAIASDNCRDPFYAYGDHDALEVLTLSTKIAQLDHPYGDWCQAITSTPADLMGLTQVGRIGVGRPADLVIFKARRYSELFARSQHDRIVLRQGQAIDTTLPDYTELDGLFAG